MVVSKSKGDGFCQRYKRLRRRFENEVGENRAHYGEASQNIREELVRCLWFGSHFSPDELRTDEGKRVEVISPGWWNVEGGPDFRRAEILLEGKGRMVGDVEIHTRAPGWYGHGHHKQPEYNDVCLHVVMWQSNTERPIRREDGQVVPQLTLSEFLDEEIDELIEIVDLEGEDQDAQPHSPAMQRYCGEALANGDMDPAWLGSLLDCAGDQRIIDRAEHLAEEMANHPPEEVLYRRIADALGYKNNRMGFRQLASALPIHRLQEIVPSDASPRDKRRVLEAAYYGVGGFLQNATPAQDDATEAYLDDLTTQWNELPSDFNQFRMSDAHWDFGGTRPVNFPVRRIAALAGIYASYLPAGLLGDLCRTAESTEPDKNRRLDTTVRDALTSVFTTLEHPYWDRRFSFGGKRLSRRNALVGEQRARAILVDVLIPVLIARGRMESNQKLLNRIHEVWNRLPRRQPNTVVERMQNVMFGGDPLVGDVIDSARRQQGLHQIHNDFCAAPEGCEACLVHLAHESGENFRE